MTGLQTGLDRRRLPLLCLAAAVAASAAFLLALGSHLTFFREDWELLVGRQDWTADSLMRPFLEHIVLAPTLIYKLLIVAFGVESALPFRVVSVAAFSLSVVLLFFWLRRRVGSWPALLGAISIAFLGAAYEDLLWSFQIGYLGCTAAGMGMLLQLDREDHRGDLLASVLLAVSLSFSSLGIAFAAGALVNVVLGERRRRERLFVVLAPLALFAAWWLGWGRHADSSLSLGNLTDAPRWVVEAIGAGVASLLGLAGDGSGTDGTRTALNWALALGALGAVGLRIRQLRDIPRDTAVAIAIGLTFWTLAAMNHTVDRPPDASRYQFPSAVFLLLIAGSLLRGVRFDRRVLVAASAVTAMAALSGSKLLYDQYEERWLPASDSLRASLGGLEIAGGNVRRDFTVAFPPNMSQPVSDYRRLVRQAGSPGFSESELLARGEPYVSIADSEIITAAEMHLRPSRRPARLDGCNPLVSGGRVAVASGTYTLVAHGRAPADIGLSRFSTIDSVPIGEIAPASAAELRIPADRSTRPWRILLQGPGPVLLCRSGLVAGSS